MPLERSRRRDDFDERYSSPVVLSDGQAWFLPKPWVAIHPVFADGRPVDSWKCFTYGPDLDALIEAIRDAEGTVDSVMAGVALAAFLLRRNYDLSDEDLAAILVYQVGDDASRAWLSAVFDVATGYSGPKA